MALSRMLISFIDTLYIKPLERVISRQMFGYFLCGAANMALDTLWYFLTYHYVVMERNVDLGIVVISPHIAALIIVFPITFFTGFLLNRYVAFRATQQRTTKQLFRYALSVVGSILLNYALMKLFVELCYVWPTIAKMMTTIIVALYSFLAAKYFSFTNK
ncbi:MAG: GtrA family protein [Alistipes sp.]|nr:GtrA family protein [Alistipes sp.]